MKRCKTKNLSIFHSSKDQIQFPQKAKITLGLHFKIAQSNILTKLIETFL